MKHISSSTVRLSAQAWLVKLDDGMDLLETMPNRCGFIRENKAFEQEARVSVFLSQSHLHG